MTAKTELSAPKRRTRAEVQQLVAEFASSGMQRSEFCRSRQLSFSTLDRHMKKLRWKRKGRLEAISQMPQQNNAATKVEHPEKILCISFVAHDQSPEVLQPGKQSLNLPASPIAAHATQVLRCVFSITTVRSD
jgi:hypothetical protein